MNQQQQQHQHNTSIKAVIFDLGGVVLGSPLEGIAEYEKRNNLPVNYVNGFITGYGPKGAFQRLERGEISVDQFIRDFDKEINNPKAIEIVRNYFNNKGIKSLENDKTISALKKVRIDTRILFKMMIEKSNHANRDMLHALFVLRCLGYKTCALTNNFSPMSDEKSNDDGDFGFKGLSSYFDMIIESVVVGMRKPDPKIFLFAANELGVDVKECAFLDDIGINVKSARSLGMHTVRVELGKNKEAIQMLEKILHLKPHTLLPPNTPEEYNRPLKLSVAAGAGNPPGRLVFDLYGSASDQPVLFYHGGGQTRHAWGRSGPELAKHGFCCMMFDLKGHGESYWDRVNPPFQYGPNLVAIDIDETVHKLKLEDRKPILIGASLGGLSSMASNAGQNIAGALVLVDVTPKLEPQGVARVMGFMIKHIEDGFETLEDVVKAVSAYTSHRVRKASDSNGDGSQANKQSDSSFEGLKKNLRYDEIKKRWFFHYDPQFATPSANQKENLEFLEAMLNSCAESIQCPVLLVRGKLTDLISDEGLRRLQQVIPHTEYVDVEHAGHMIAGDRNDVFLEVITKWLLEKRDKKRNAFASDAKIAKMSNL